MEGIFLFVYDHLKNNRTLFYFLFFGIFILLGWGASRIKIEEDVSKFFPSDKKLEKANLIFSGSKLADKVVLMVALKDSTVTNPDQLISFTESLVTKIQTNLNPYINKITYRVDDSMMVSMFDLITENIPVFLNKNDYSTLDSITRPAIIQTTLQNSYRQLISPSGIALKNIIIKDPIGITGIALRKLQLLQNGSDFELYDNYFVTKDHRNLILFISAKFPPNDTGNNSIFLSKLDDIINSDLHEIPHVKVDYFGAAAVANGNARQLHRDTLLTVSLMLALMVFFLIGFLRKKSAPFIIFIPVLFGGLFSLTIIYIIQGSISVLAIAAGSIVLGIAVNYSLHFLSHLKDTGNVRQVIKDLVTPMTLGSATTVLAFLSLQYANAFLLRDIGLFAGLSLVGAALCSLLFLPHLVHDNFFGGANAHRGWSVNLFTIKPKQNKIFIFLIFILTPLMLYFANRVEFNSDMRKLNYMSEALKQTEAKLNQFTNNSGHSVYVVADGRTMEEALKNNEMTFPTLEKLKQEGTIKKYSSVSTFLISDSLQQKRIEQWNAYWTSGKKKAVMDIFQNEARKLKFNSKIISNFDSILNRHYQVMSVEQNISLKESLFDEYIIEKPGLVTIVTLATVAVEKLDMLYRSFANEKHAEPFDKRMLTNLFVKYVHADFTFIVTFTSILVFLVLLISYGRIELALITFIPMLITWIWILGMMGILGIEFNIVNVMISTFIFGLGDDYSIFIMDGLQKEYKTGVQTLSSIQGSIFLSAITTISGLGVLIFAQHPALKSIASISIIGIITVFIMSQTIEPFLFSFFISARANKKLPPVTFLKLIQSTTIYMVFVLGALMLSATGFVLFKILRLSNKGSRYAYHSILQFFMHLLLYLGVQIRKNIIAKKDRYDTPRIIISNHQSFIDILVTTMLHPKVLLLTNNWVWNSPIFGYVVRMAEFYPIDAGLDSGLENLKKRVEEGYSIMVFPEGTRSFDGSIGRFHKGAFYLSEKLKLDIMPLLIYGTGDAIRKNDLFIENADLTLKFLEPIAYDNVSFGTSYTERTKSISQFFKKEYDRLVAEVETPKHFRYKLWSNYLYKGPVLEWYLKIKLRLENYYEPFHRFIPKNSSVLDLGCGYGFLSYMLHFLSPTRQVTGVDYDEVKISIAQHGYLRGEYLNFVHADITQYTMEHFDAIIISDTLHYLSNLQQVDLLEKCFKTLNPDGILILRDGDRALKQKHKGTLLTEFFSVTLLGFNKSNQPLNYISGEFIRELAEKHGLDFERVNTQNFTSNVIFAIRKKKQNIIPSL